MSYSREMVCKAPTSKAKPLFRAGQVSALSIPASDMAVLLMNVENLEIAVKSRRIVENSHRMLSAGSFAPWAEDAKATWLRICQTH